MNFLLAGGALPSRSRTTSSGIGRREPALLLRLKAVSEGSLGVREEVLYASEFIIKAYLGLICTVHEFDVFIVRSIISDQCLVCSRRTYVYITLPSERFP